jgi:HK97 family phage major capsid protein
MFSAAKDKMDSTFIRSVGTQNEPRGLLYWAAAANKFYESNGTSTSGGSSTAQISHDLAKAIRLLHDNNMKMIKPGWIFSPRTMQRLYSELGVDGSPVFRPEMAAGTLFGYPYKVTSNVPSNLTAQAGSGSGSDASEIYFCDFFDILIGETETLAFSTSEHAAYTVSGSLVSAFERGETLLKVEMEHDLAARRGGTEIVVIESVTWGTTA